MELDNKKRIATLRVLYLSTAIYISAITVLSHIPGDLLSFPVYWDKAAHFVEYIPLGILVAGWLIYRTNTPRRNPIFFASVCILAVFGFADELHQSFVPGRFVSFWDVVADTLGGSVGALLGIWIYLARIERKSTF